MDAKARTLRMHSGIRELSNLLWMANLMPTFGSYYSGADGCDCCYELKAEDLEGPFVESIPIDLTEMADMERLSYTGLLSHCQKSSMSIPIF